LATGAPNPLEVSEFGGQPGAKSSIQGWLSPAGGTSAWRRRAWGHAPQHYFFQYFRPTKEPYRAAHCL